jgi:signal transduction histidine kinase
MKLRQETELYNNLYIAGRHAADNAPKTSSLSAVVLSTDERKVERVLATARALLAFSLLTAIYLAPKSSSLGYMTPVVLAAYCMYSVCLILAQRFHRAPNDAARISTHVADILWAGILTTMFAATAYSPFVVFLIFPLLAAAMRWGFRATMVTAGATIAVLFVVVIFASSPVIAGEAHAAEQRLSVGAVSLLILGFLLGFLGEHEKQLRSDAMTVARVAGQAHKAITPNETVAAVFSELFRVFDPALIQLAIHEIPTGRIHVWESSRAGGQRIACRDLDFSHRTDLLFKDSTHHIMGFKAGKSGDSTVEYKIFDASGQPINGAQYSFREDWFPERLASFVCVPVVFGSEWEVRLFLWDPLQSKATPNLLLAVTDFANRVSPTIFAAALQHHLRSRATAEERARVARELHDGIMQSLVALDMKMEVVKKVCARDTLPLLKEITSIQQVLRNEILGLREIIQANRRIEVGPTQLIPFLSETVSKFQRESRITSRFICELEEAPLPAAVCYEVARIVQESMTNVRKHSGATTVIVRFAQLKDKWLLVITDDGRGFDFVGRFSLDELDEARKGPAVIKQRVRTISGDMTIESAPNRGTCLEITFPKEEEK